MRVSSLSALRLSLEECLQKPGECTKSLQTGVSNAKYEQAVVIASFVLLLLYSFYSSITENKWLLLNFLTSEKRQDTFNLHSELHDTLDSLF